MSLIPFDFRNQEKELSAIISKHFMCVVGTYVGRIMSGKEPDRVECVVEYERLQDLKDDLVLLGYNIKADEETFSATHNNLLPLKIFVMKPRGPNQMWLTRI